MFMYDILTIFVDKSARSYFDFYESVRSALDRNNLTLQAETFISDFEENIPKGFNKYFPDIETQVNIYIFIFFYISSLI